MRTNSAVLYEMAQRIAVLEKTDPGSALRLLDTLDADDRKTVMDAVRILFRSEYARA